MISYAISTSFLSKHFNGTTAIDGVSLNVPPGSIYGFLGPNGAGKTTTIRLLLGLIKPTSGHATVLGYNSLYHDGEIRKKTGVLLEDDALYSRLSIYENLKFHGEINRIPQPLLARKIEVALRSIRLWDRQTEPAIQFSKGLRRKVALSRALLHDPQLLILDEPTAGLDPSSIASIRDILKALSTSGITIFLATHNLSEAERLCDHIGIINNGRLLHSGPTADLLSRMRNPIIQIACEPSDEITIGLVTSIPGVISCSIHEGRLHVTMSDARLTASVTRTLVNSGISIESIIPLSRKLEDFYLSMVEGTEE